MSSAVLESPLTAITQTPFLSASIERSWQMEPSLAEDVSASMQSQAVHVVREIRDIADGLWATERNSVELKFNFGGSDQLSVRVEYRNGDVNATFRTNSDELRATLSDEWQSQVAAHGGVNFRLQPITFEREAPSARAPFSANEQTARDQQQFSQNARDEARQQHDQRAPLAEARLVSDAAIRRNVSATSLPRTDSARLLHTHA